MVEHDAEDSVLSHLSRRKVLAMFNSGGAALVAGCSDRPPDARTLETSTEPTDTLRTDPSTTSTQTSTAAEEALPNPLSVDNANPYVYINDQNDNYNAELALAMASRGYIDLRGFLFGYAGEPWLKTEQFERRREDYESHHLTVHEKAVESGFENLPPAEIGIVGGRHERPETGVIEETEPIGSRGTDRIVREARDASKDNPLVLAVGCDLCTVADAYLQDPSIAERLVVFLNWTGSPEKPGYNVLQSGWSASVVLEQLSTVLVGGPSPLIKKEQVMELPDVPLRQFMLSKEHFKYGNPLENGRTWDGDSTAILSAAHPNTRAATRSVRVTGQTDPHFEADFQIPTLSYGSGAEKLKGITEATGLTRALWRHLGDDSIFSERTHPLGGSR